jgi:hypothetical protein
LPPEKIIFADTSEVAFAGNRNRPPCLKIALVSQQKRGFRPVFCPHAAALLIGCGGGEKTVRSGRSGRNWRWAIECGETRIDPTEISLQGSPDEPRTRVLLATRRNVFVASNVGNRQPRGDGGAQAGEGGVLRGLEATTFQPFQLDTDGMVVAIVPAAPMRRACVPSPRGDIHELHQFAVASNEEMGGHRQASNLLEVGVGIPIELVGEQLFDLGATELARRQADGVDDDQVDQGAIWPRAKVG